MSQANDRTNVLRKPTTWIPTVLALVLVAFAAGWVMNNRPGSGGGSTSSPQVNTQSVGFEHTNSSDVLHDDDYPHDTATPDPWGGFDARECTSFVAWRATSRDHVDMAALTAKAQKAYGAGHNGDTYLNAGKWADAFSAVGVPVDSTPAVGAAAVQYGNPGHVAWVTSVQGATMTIEDYNELWDHAYHSWTGVPVAAFNAFVHFEQFGAGDAQQNAPQGGIAQAGGQLKVVTPTTQPTLRVVPLAPQPTVTVRPPASHAPLPVRPADPGTTQGSSVKVQGSGQGTGGGAAAPPVTATTGAAQPVVPSLPVFTVMNTSESLPDGVWFRNSTVNSDTDKITGLGVYAGEQVRLRCYAMGDPVGPSDHLWYLVDNLSRTSVDGRANSGYLNAHYINDGKLADQVDAGVPHC